MQFHQVFSRYVGTVPAGKKALGSDVIPVDAAATQRAPDQSLDDNVLYCRFLNLEGWPVHRVAVAYRAPSGVLALTATMYFWESQLERWIQVGAPGTVTPGQVSFFDCVSLLDTLQTRSGLDQGSPTRGSLAQLLIVDAGLAPGGEHRFAIGADLSTST
jgi:hypothetical protein